MTVCDSVGSWGIQDVLALHYQLLSDSIHYASGCKMVFAYLNAIALHSLSVLIMFLFTGLFFLIR